MNLNTRSGRGRPVCERAVQHAAGPHPAVLLPTRSSAKFEETDRENLACCGFQTESLTENGRPPAIRHSRESGNPGAELRCGSWTPAFAGATISGRQSCAYFRSDAEVTTFLEISLLRRCPMRYLRRSFGAEMQPARRCGGISE